MFQAMRPIFTTIFCLGCSDPFSIDRHDLTEPRIIGIRKVNESYIAQVWNGAAAFHLADPKLKWFDTAGVELGDGVVFTDISSVPTLVEYEDDFGQIHQAEFNAQDYEEFFSLSMQTMVDTVSYSLQERQEQLGADILDGVSTEHTRLITETEETQQLRWTTAQGIGSFLELNRESTDFYWKDIVLEREEIIKDEAILEQYTTVFALSINQEGHTQWQWIDLWREPQELPLLRHRNRYFPIDLELQEETDILVTIEQSESLFGFEFIDPEVITEDSEIPDPLGCALEDTSFQWWWVEIGICTMDDLTDQRIRLQVSP